MSNKFNVYCLMSENKLNFSFEKGPTTIQGENQLIFVTRTILNIK